MNDAGWKPYAPDFFIQIKDLMKCSYYESEMLEEWGGDMRSSPVPDPDVPAAFNIAIFRVGIKARKQKDVRETRSRRYLPPWETSKQFLLLNSSIPIR